MKYPNDPNGDALRRMEAQGDDLTRPRNIEFAVVFPDENTATQFANHFSALGFSASAELAGTVPDFPWEVIILKHMLPSHEEIAAFEHLLEQAAAALGGHNDGWGCFSENPPSPST